MGFDKDWFDGLEQVTDEAFSLVDNPPTHFAPTIDEVIDQLGYPELEFLDPLKEFEDELYHMEEGFDSRIQAAHKHLYLYSDGDPFWRGLVSTRAFSLLKVFQPSAQ